MKKQMKLPRFTFILLAWFVIFLTANLQTFAQKKSYKPGEKIEYKASYSKDEWANGTFVEQSWDGKQPIIRDAQNFQMALPNWDWVRPITAQPEARPVDENNRQEAAPDNNNAADDKPLATTGDGVMSQADVLSFAETNIGGDPLSNPRRSKIIQTLVEEVKRRGVSFRHEGGSPFANQLIKAIGGMDLDLTWALRENYGAPTKQSWLISSWKLDIVGATTEYEKDGDIYRKEASAAANIGKLTINPDGTYLWHASVPVATFRGNWRKATAEEMKTQGGDGIVLLNAKSGWDWIVIQNRTWTNRGDLIWVSDLSTRQMREIGSR